MRSKRIRRRITHDTEHDIYQDIDHGIETGGSDSKKYYQHDANIR